MLAFCHSRDTVPVSYDFLNVSVNIREILFASFFKTLGLILCGLAALYSFKPSNNLCMPGVVKFISQAFGDILSHLIIKLV